MARVRQAAADLAEIAGAALKMGVPADVLADIIVAAIPDELRPILAARLADRRGGAARAVVREPARTSRSRRAVRPIAGGRPAATRLRGSSGGGVGATTRDGRPSR